MYTSALQPDMVLYLQDVIHPTIMTCDHFSILHASNLLQTACKHVCRLIYDRKVVDCGVIFKQQINKQPN